MVQPTGKKPASPVKTGLPVTPSAASPSTPTTPSIGTLPPTQKEGTGWQPTPPTRVEESTTQFRQARFDVMLKDAGITANRKDRTVTAERIDTERLPGGLDEVARAAGPDGVLQIAELDALRVNRDWKEIASRWLNLDPMGSASKHIDATTKDVREAVKALKQFTETIKQVPSVTTDSERRQTVKEARAALADVTSAVPHIYFSIADALETGELHSDLVNSSEASMKGLRSALEEMAPYVRPMMESEVKTADGWLGAVARNSVYNTKVTLMVLSAMARQIDARGWPNLDDLVVPE